MNINSQVRTAMTVFNDTLDEHTIVPTLNPYFKNKIALAYARTLKRHFVKKLSLKEFDEYYDVLEDEIKKEFGDDI